MDRSSLAYFWEGGFVHVLVLEGIEFAGASSFLEHFIDGPRQFSRTVSVLTLLLPCATNILPGWVDHRERTFAALPARSHNPNLACWGQTERWAGLPRPV
jgi:hypothetical protein